MNTLDLFIPGLAKSKGSLRHLGNGRMAEQVTAAAAEGGGHRG